MILVAGKRRKITLCTNFKRICAVCAVQWIFWCYLWFPCPVPPWLRPIRGSHSHLCDFLWCLVSHQVQPHQIVETLQGAVWLNKLHRASVILFLYSVYLCLPATYGGWLKIFKPQKKLITAPDFWWIIFQLSSFQGQKLSPAALKCLYPGIEGLFCLRLQEFFFDRAYDLVATGKMVTSKGFFHLWEHDKVRKD